MSSSYNYPKSEQHHHGQQQQSTSSSLLPSSVPSSSSNTLIGTAPNGITTTTTTNNNNNNNMSVAVAVDENVVVRDYVPPGTIRSPPPNNNKGKNNNNSNGGNGGDDNHNDFAAKQVQWVYNPADGSILTDHNNMPVSVDRLLATKPLRHELSTRPGPGNKKLTYLSGEGVSRTLNDVFGFDGWDLDIQNVSREACTKDAKTGKHSVVYTARVRLTHKKSGAYKEDCGAGDSTDRNFGTAISHALKASITDAMKRAARHFGK
jgi:DNA recombination protein Rad52